MFYLWEMLKFKQFIALTHSRMAISRICKKEQQKTIILHSKLLVAKK